MYIDLTNYGFPKDFFTNVLIEHTDFDITDTLTLTLYIDRYNLFTH